MLLDAIKVIFSKKNWFCVFFKRKTFKVLSKHKFLFCTESFILVTTIYN